MTRDQCDPELTEQIKQAQRDLRDRSIQPLVGQKVVSMPLPARSDLSDWVDLMELVEALCPEWPAQRVGKDGTFKL